MDRRDMLVLAVAVAILAGLWWLHGRTHAAAAPNAPIPPGSNPQSGDRTAQNPKVVPWNG